eukprot:gene214-385_t
MFKRDLLWQCIFALLSFIRNDSCALSIERNISHNMREYMVSHRRDDSMPCESTSASVPKEVVIIDADYSSQLSHIVGVLQCMGYTVSIYSISYPHRQILAEGFLRGQLASAHSSNITQILGTIDYLNRIEQVLLDRELSSLHGVVIISNMKICDSSHDDCNVSGNGLRLVETVVKQLGGRSEGRQCSSHASASALPPDDDQGRCPWLLQLSLTNEHYDYKYAMIMAMTHVNMTNAEKRDGYFKQRKSNQINIEYFLNKTHSHIGGAIVLKVSEVYGSVDDLPDLSFTAAIVHNAMVDAPIQLPGHNRKLNFVHVSDFRRAVFAAVLKLKLSSSNMLESSSSRVFDVVRVGGSKSIRLRDVVSFVFNITDSKSPMTVYSNINLPDVPSVSLTKLRSRLGVVLAFPSLRQGLLQYVLELNKRDLGLISEKYKRSCPPPSHIIESHEYEYDGCHAGFFGNSRFNNMTVLDCRRVIVGYPQVNQWWTIWGLGPSYAIDFNRGNIYGVQMEMQEGSVQWGDVSIPLFRLSCGFSSTDKEYAYYDEKENEIKLSTDKSSLFQFIYHRPTALHAMLVYPTYTNSPSRYTPPRQVRLDTSTRPFHYSSLEKIRPTDVELFAITPYDCEPTSSNKARLPFLATERHPQLWRELDSENFNPYNRDGLPNSIKDSAQSPVCRRIQHSKAFINDHITRQSRELDLFYKSPRNQSHSNLSLHFNNHPGGNIEEWMWTHYTPVCETSCGVVGECVRTNGCRCVKPLCTHTKSVSTAIPSHRQVSLEAEVDELPRREVFLLSAWPYIGNAWSPPSLHVLSLEDELFADSNDDTRLTQLQNDSCFNADYFILKTLKTLSVPLAEAQLVFPTFYHGHIKHNLDYDDETLRNTFLTAVSSTVSRVWSSKAYGARLAWILSHDMGGCLYFRWNHRMVEPFNNQQMSVLKSSFVLQAMGDYNTNCYMPHKDTVIAPTTCSTLKLIDRFGDLNAVRRVNDRKYFIFFRGSYWGTGKVLRIRLSSPSLYPNTNASSMILQGSSYEDFRDVLDTMGDAVFCLHIPGVAGWSFRLSDIVYSGCIPVLIAGYTHYPYQDILDYKKFSVVVESEHLDRIEDILRGISLEERASLQRHLLKARDAFLYDVDLEQSVQSLKQQQGPVFFSLLSLKIKLSMNFNVTKRKRQL